MLDPKIIRDEPEKIKEMLKDRAVDFDLEKMLELNKVRKDMMQQTDELKQKRNQMSMKIATEKKAGNDASELLKEMSQISSKLDDLRSEIKKIENCELKKNASKIVFSDGNNKSKIMIVGEGPGQKEDQEGKPFVGDAGLLLNKMLKSINIERKNVYITNVVNYRPPNNRKPEPAEITKYSNFLRKHISIIDPKILILMGKMLDLL